MEDPPTASVSAGLIQSLGVPGVDGLSLVQNWSSIEPEMGVYQWDTANGQPWTADRTYVRGDTVSYNGVLYVSQIDDNTATPDPSCTTYINPTCAWHPTGATSANLLDQWLDAAILAGNKKIMLAVRAGEDTPCWLFELPSKGGTPPCGPGFNSDGYAGAALYPLMASAHQGMGNKCETVNMAAPWDPHFLKQWEAMLAALETHLKNTPSPNPNYSLYDFVTIVRMTGINRTTDEFRIPAEILEKPCSFNAIDTWVNAALVTGEENATNYLPSRLVTAWDTLTQSYHDHFGDKYFNVAVIGTDSGSTANRNAGNAQFPFPYVDNNGCVYSMYLPTTFTPTWTREPCFNNGTIGSGGGSGDDSPDQNHDLIALASQKFPGKLTVEVENLHDHGQFPDYKPSQPAHNVIGYAEDFGTAPAYMTNNYFGAAVATKAGGMSCGPLSNPTRCFPAQYLDVLETGLAPDAIMKKNSDAFLHSQFLEIFFPDANQPECTPYSPPAMNPVAPGSACGYPHEVLAADDFLFAAPLVTISFPAVPGTYWYNQLPLGGEVAATASAGNSISTLECSGAATGSGAAGFTLTIPSQGADQIVKCRATDSAGNMGESIRAVWTDNQPPVTTANVTVLNKLGQEEVTLAATDNLSGVARTQYRVNGGPWASGTAIPLLVNGTFTIQFRSTDVAGNVEPTQSITVKVVLNIGPPPCRGHSCK